MIRSIPRAKRQFIVHRKWATNIGVEKASQPTPPAGVGWELRAVTIGTNDFWFFWERYSRQPIPENEFPPLRDPDPLRLLR